MEIAIQITLCACIRFLITHRYPISMNYIVQQYKYSFIYWVGN